MNALIKYRNLKKFIVSAILGSLVSYTAALRLTDFLMQTRAQKGILFISLFFLIGLLVFFLYHPFITFLQRNISQNAHRILILSAIFLTIFIFIPFYRLPPFPQTLHLEIVRDDSPEPEHHRGEIKILSITRVNLPLEQQEPVNIAQLTYDAPWFSEENQLQTRYGDNTSGSVQYSRFMQARLDIEFQTGPSNGTVIIKWNDDRLVYDLNEKVESTKLVQLTPPLRWVRADLTRKAMLGTNFISEFLLTTQFFYLLGLVIIKIFITKEIAVRGVWTIFAVILASTSLIFISNRLQKEVRFDDPNLENVIRIKIEKPEGPIYQHQLLTIATLDANHKQINSISGIEHLRNLKMADLSGNAISDLNPLASLEKLTDLNLSENQIVDLQAVNFHTLKGLNLERLILRNNISLERAVLQPGLSDIKILAEFSTLRELDLGRNRITDIETLAELEDLKILYLDSNQVSDIRPLEGLTGLIHLNLAKNNITDIFPLKDLLYLKYLNLSSNTSITDLTPLNDLVNIEDLNLNNIYVGDSLGFIRNMNQLNELDLRNCGISDLSDIGFLMESGQLQDDSDRGNFAEINIRDNPLEVKDLDAFAPVRKYWTNITYRDPVALPPYNTLEVPIFSHHGGFYVEQFQLAIHSADPNSVILYTLDGSEPKVEDINSTISEFQLTRIYEQPITIKNRAGDPNVFSMINTADLVNEWLPLWLPPEGEVYKANIIRAMAYNNTTGEHSAVVTHTYFVDENIYQRYPTLPVISLSSDYQYLFEPETGIYTTGKLSGIFYPPIIFNESVVPANLEFFNSDGSLGFNGVYEIELQGNTSRASPQKGLMVSANGWYGDELLEFPLFSTSESEANQITSYKQFIIRAWGSARDWQVIFSDAYHQTLMAKSDQDIQDYRPVIVFINGEYWGLHELREADKNSWYHQFHTGIDRLDPGYDLIDRGYGQVDEGTSEDWDELMVFIANHDLSIPENYQYVETKIDIDNFIHYVIHCIYTGKRDWPDHNESKWRVHNETGKWRWVQYDMDHGLSHFGRPEYDMVFHTAFDEEHLHPLFAALLANKDFEVKFLNYFADDLNTYFLKEVEIDHFKKMNAELAPYIPEYQDRWQLNQDWEEDIQSGLNLIKRRNELRWEQIISNFKLEGTAVITLKTDPKMGNVQINSINIDQNIPGINNPFKWSGTYFLNLPIQISAVPQPGYRFVRWNGVSTNAENPTITITPTEDMILRAVFSPDL